MIPKATFIHSDPGHAKMDKPLEVKQKQGETGMENGKRVLNRTLNTIS